jgi:hypothetical protein
MDCLRLIPWTPRTVRKQVTPVVAPAKAEPIKPSTLCERTLDVLQPIIFKALKPFPEAREALRLAFNQWAAAEELAT